MNTETVIKNINEKHDEIFIRNGSGEYRPRVCIICDEIVKHEDCIMISLSDIEKNRNILSDNGWNSIDILRTEQYSIDSTDVEVQATTIGLMLSPRATEMEDSCSTKKSQLRKGFTGCKKCKYNLSRHQMPPFAIANNHTLGMPPDCLTELNNVLEIALLTPVKTYGYCFSYTGGIQKQLKGSLSYYKVKIESIASAVESFNVSGLYNNIVVV